jgi:hypothetical protein
MDQRAALKAGDRAVGCSSMRPTWLGPGRQAVATGGGRATDDALRLSQIVQRDPQRVPSPLPLLPLRLLVQPRHQIVGCR